MELLQTSGDAIKKLKDNTEYFRAKMSAAGFELHGVDHPICPVMLYDAKIAKALAEKLLAKGIYVIAFSYPVVPEGQARIRVQISAAHEREHLDKCIAAFVEVGKEMGIIK